MRNALIYEMGDKINRYTTRRRYCELYINGDYRGVYMFMENIKRDDNRVDIATLLPIDTAGNELTGGYIMKVDRIQGDFDGGWASPYPRWGTTSSSSKCTNPRRTTCIRSNWRISKITSPRLSTRWPVPILPTHLRDTARSSMWGPSSTCTSPMRSPRMSMRIA